jgi:hypothetical protein
LEDLKTFPDEVQRVMGYALYLAQVGGKHLDAKPLKGFGGAGSRPQGRSWRWSGGGSDERRSCMRSPPRRGRDESDDS